jgi:hypothetical protein
MKTVFDAKRKQRIPAEIARFAAGRDAYLRDATVHCDECHQPYVLKDSDSAEVCQECFDQAGEENARLDSGGAQ